MHVAFAINNLASGGAQRQVVEIAARVHAQPDFSATVLVYERELFYAKRLREAGVPLVVLPKHAKYDPLLPLRIRKWLIENRPDVLHAFLLRPALWHLIALRMLPRVPRPRFLVAERSSLAATHGLERRCQGFVYRASDGVTVNAESVAREVQSELAVHGHRVHYIPNGIDLESWDDLAARTPPFRREADTLQLALVGGLRPEKNHHLVLEALARTAPARRRRWRLWFVGGETAGPEAARRIRRQIEREGLDDVVRIVPATAAIAALMRQIDVLLLPSRYEGFPNVALEAMATRVPVIAAPVGDVPKLMQHKASGWLLDRVDPESLSHAIVELDELGVEGRRELGDRARRTVERRFAMPVVASRYTELYRRLTSPRGSPPSASRR